MAAWDSEGGGEGGAEETAVHLQGSPRISKWMSE